MDLSKLLLVVQGAKDGSEYLDYAIQRVLFRMTKPVPRYTRSLDGAMALLPDGWTISRLGELGDCKGGTRGWLADIFHPSDAVILYPAEATSPTAPLALCVAALRARLGMSLQSEEPVRRRATR